MKLLHDRMVQGCFGFRFEINRKKVSDPGIPTTGKPNDEATTVTTGKALIPSGAPKNLQKKTIE